VHLLAGCGGPEDYIAGVTKTGARTEEIATNAGLFRGENRNGISESFAVTTIENAAFCRIDAVSVFVHNHIRIRRIGAAVS
jgi:hypothetical protein